MGKQTIIPINHKGYTVERGYANNPDGPKITLTFDRKIIAMMGLHYLSGKHYPIYYFNPKLKFWENAMGSETYPLSTPTGYIYNTTYNNSVTKNSDYSITVTSTIRGSTSAAVPGSLTYMVILEGDLEVDPPKLFLTRNTIVYTDGTPTATVENAIATMSENKYKVKADSLVTISDATYLRISN
ncbi:MAG: hypothetical protein J6Q89_08785 [Clostridia bacterium]|nr:hypothetical protein [Clostridia bacterium]